jgi:hypothetical protein
VSPLIGRTCRTPSAGHSTNRLLSARTEAVLNAAEASLHAWRGCTAARRRPASGSRPDPGFDRSDVGSCAREEGVAESRQRPLCVPRNVRSRSRARAAAGSGGGDQYITAATVTVTCCSSRPTVGDRPDQHVTVAGTAMVRCRPCPARSATTCPCRGGRQRCSPWAKQRWVPSRPRRDGGDAPFLRRGTLSTVTHPVERSRLDDSATVSGEGPFSRSQRITYC